MSVDALGFDSEFRRIGSVDLPPFSGVRVMMMPLVLGDLASIPLIIGGWTDALRRLFDMAPEHTGKVGYITIDEKPVRANETHRRAGKHVDGVNQGRAGGWGGGGGGWGAHGTGMLTVASPAGCRAWRGRFSGWPGMEGECEHLADQCGEPTLFEAGVAYWVDGLCVHESVPMERDTNRQFARLSLPSEAPWFEGYTENPLGVKPTGPILARREFMDLSAPLAREG